MAICLTILAYPNFRPHYNLDLRSISVGGQVLSIDPSVFSTSSNQGTIVDSGTTLAYLADEAYDAFVSAVSIELEFTDTWTLEFFIFKKTMLFTCYTLVFLVYETQVQYDCEA